MMPGFVGVYRPIDAGYKHIKVLGLGLSVPS